MQCFSGIALSSGLKVPCGQCINCRINKSRKWTARILLEHIHGIKPTGHYDWFVTLTYDEAHVPKLPNGTLTLDKAGFLYWLRLYQKRRHSFRYFAVGEYGSLKGRPHYHLVCFSLTIDQVQAFLARWTKCHPDRKDASLLTDKRAAYIAQYASKKLVGNHNRDLPPDLEPEFRTSTRLPPIGAPCLPSLLATYRRKAGSSIIATRGDVERSVRIGGQVYPLDGWILGRLRSALGIPLTHHERAKAHPDYLRYHNMTEAEKCHDQATQARRKHVATTKTKNSITWTVD